MATNHTYETGTYAGLTLHIITTAASNIQLVNFRNGGNMMSLRNSSYFGINGSFYNRDSSVRTNQIISIATNNGSPLGPDINKDGRREGSDNYIGSGVVAWNGAQLSCYTTIAHSSEINFLSTSGTWGQGGIALWLGFSGWKDQVDSQPSGNAYRNYGAGERTALVANMNANKVYLMITPGGATMETFRNAIQSKLGIVDGAQANNTYQCVMLDGGSSTQLKAKNSAGSTINIGNSGTLPQVVVLKNNA